MKNIHIENSYKVWSQFKMWVKISVISLNRYKEFPNKVLNRSYRSMYIEWYLHNIGYILTLPFCFSKKIKKLNERFKHLDLEEHF
jgi:hypothetical protein